MAQKESRFATLDEYATYRIRQDEGISAEEGIKKAMEQIAKNIMPYDKARFGELPELLKNSQVTL
jgi:hypothetical protein